MRIYWRVASMPELSVLTDAERRALIAHIGGWVLTVRFLALSVLLAGGIGLGGHLLMNCAGAPLRVQSVFGLAAFIGGIPLVYQVLMLRTRAQLRLEIMKGFAGQRVPVCLRCGHDTRAAVDDRCAECGAPIRVPAHHAAAEDEVRA